jgi:hypothetical protein
MRSAVDAQLGRIRQRRDQLLREAVALGGGQVPDPREYLGYGRGDGPLTGLAAGKGANTRAAVSRFSFRSSSRSAAVR